MTITEKHDRNVLIEGRSSGMGFAMLKKDKTNYETVNPLSPCKDYLNEVVFTENTGYPTKAHGLDYKEKLDIFKDKVVEINYDKNLLIIHSKLPENAGKDSNFTKL